MKPHFGQSDAAMNKLAGINQFPNAGKGLELISDLEAKAKEAGCSTPLEYLRQRDDRFQREINRAAMSFNDVYLSQHDQPCDCAVCDEIHFTRSISVAPKQFKDLGERLANLLDDDDWNNIEPMLLQTLTACSDLVRDLEDKLESLGEHCKALTEINQRLNAEWSLKAVEQFNRADGYRLALQEIINAGDLCSNFPQDGRMYDIAKSALERG